jgi:hypothetical protein
MPYAAVDEFSDNTWSPIKVRQGQPEWVIASCMPHELAEGVGPHSDCRG